MSANDPPRFLLLLPPAPSSQSASSLKASYADTLSQALKEVTSHSSQSAKAAILEIALACPHLTGKRKATRSSLFAGTQSLVASIYRLICTIAAKEGIDVEDEDGVDVRILLVGWSPNSTNDESSVRPEDQYGPIVSLSALAGCGRSWQYAFGVESEQGEAMVKAFVAAKGSSAEVTSVQDGSDAEDDKTTNTTNESPSSKQRASEPETKYSTHHHVAIGGTFDHIHIGHKLLLTMTAFAVDDAATDALQERTITIGITGDELLKNKKHREVLESWEDRYRSVMTFINAIIDFSPPSSAGQRHVSVRDDPGPNGKSMDVVYPNGLVIKCTEIQDPFGPTITEERISCMILSAETRAGGKAVNDKRAEKGWKPLDLFEVDVLDAEDDSDDKKVQEGFENKLSSTAIREKLAKKRQSSL